MTIRLSCFALWMCVIWTVAAETSKQSQVDIYPADLNALEGASRRVVFLLDQSNHAQEILFAKENWANLFGSEHAQGDVEVWLRDVLGMVAVDWQSVHSNVFFYGMANRQNDWRKSFLRHVYWHRGDPFLGLNKRKEKYRSNRFSLDYAQAALPLAVLELTTFQQRNFYSEVFVVKLEVVSHRHLTLPEPEQFGGVTHFHKGLRHVEAYYLVDAIAQKDFISGVSGNLRATVYQVRPRVSEQVSSLFSELPEPRWEPTPQAVVLDYKLETHDFFPLYRIRHLAMFTDDATFRMHSLMQPQVERHGYTGQFSIAGHDPASEALPGKMVVGAWLEYVPDGMSMGLVHYDFASITIKSEDLSMVNMSPFFLWPEPKDIYAVKAMYPGLSLADIRAKVSAQRLYWLLGLLSLIVVLCLITRSIMHRMYPRVQVACLFDFEDEVLQREGVLASRSIADLKGREPILLGHLLISERDGRSLSVPQDCRYQMAASPINTGHANGAGVISLGKRQGVFQQQARLDVWLNLGQVQQPEQFIPEPHELDVGCCLNGGIFKGARRLTEISELVKVKVPLERVPFKLAVQAPLPEKRLPLRWSQVVKAHGIVGRFLLRDESGFRYRETPQLQWRKQMIGLNDDGEIEVPSAYFELQFLDGESLDQKRFQKEFERSKALEIQVALNLEQASFFNQAGFYHLELSFVNGRSEVSTVLMFQISAG